MKSKIPVLYCVLIGLLSGCASEGGFKLPGVYRIDIQQGNVVEQEMIARLRPGMDKTQVRLIMGTPVLVDPFHTNRWEYVYSLSERGGRREQRHVTLYFEDDKLSYVQGDVTPSENIPTETGLKKTRTVDVPLKNKKSGKGFFRNLFGILPFVGHEEPTLKEANVKKLENQAEDALADEEINPVQDETESETEAEAEQETEEVAEPET